jgi:exopolyphosphatase / guanosine-5'-triphosphate,3'-diphosphate pyrophosphatase
MNDIIPRWEWRSFGSHFGDAEIRLKSRGAGKLQHSDEIYLLSLAYEANVKIREGLLDIKGLEQKAVHGFEQWRPVLKEAFPLSAAAIDAVYAALGIESSQDLAPITLDQLLAEVKSDSRVRTLQVHKKRTRYQVEDCMAELTEVIANGKTIRTIAVESEDPDHITSALRALNLEGLENVSYPRGLKRLLDMAG